MSQRSIRTERVCLERATSIKQTAEMLHNQGDDWFAVCYFYAAYHLVRGAIMSDPIFESLPRLTSKAPWLTLEDRYVEAHQGRVSPGQARKAGVNDVVKLFYPEIAAEYVRLHMSSVEVRYLEGLRGIHRDTVLTDYAAVETAYLERRLIAS